MTVAEFTRSIPDIGGFNHTDRIKLFAWYLLRYQNKNSFTASDIAACFKDTLFDPPSTIPPFLTSLADRKPRVLITRSKGVFAMEHNLVEEFDKRYGQRPSAVIVSRDLRGCLAGVKDAALTDYLTETVGCFESQHFRASIVMGWCAGYFVLKHWLFSRHVAALNAVMATWKKPTVISRIEDFDELGERVVIDTARNANGGLTKEEHKQLVALLDERNSYAHPSGRKVSSAIAEAYLMRIIDEVVKKFS